MNKYTEYKSLNLSELGNTILKQWENGDIFEQSLKLRANSKPYIFYEGPPSANGTPGIHHVMARTIKDIFCRYKTMKGFLVERKAGWDTHGLPIEISVEKTLGITKEDIGTKISVDEYNRACRKEVMKYKDLWDDLTKKIGYWVDLSNPYITFDNKYIESVWHLISKLYEKGLLYKGYTIQPFSPAAGTGLSAHELNQPGCYKNVKDNTVVAQFKVIKNEKSEFLFNNIHGELFFLAWTTTPWTLPSNTALAIGKDIEYVKVKTFNAYTYKPITVILAKELFSKYFSKKNNTIKLSDYNEGDKAIPFELSETFKGDKIKGISYEQLLPYAQPNDGEAFKVIIGDFVTTEDGTGIVHIAPSFGADDFKVAKLNGIGSLTLVDKQGRFVEEMGEFARRYVKTEYHPNYNAEKNNEIENVDIDIIVKLKKENKAFKSEKYEHSYPHCWRTDKPILYYPLDSWFIKTTDLRDRMIELNKTINWKPEATGTGRFGNWLENLLDWNLSRSRYWGTPLPIWVDDNGDEKKCIGSLKELKIEIEKSIKAGFMKTNPLEAFNINDFSNDNFNTFDLHRPYVDDIILVSSKGEQMKREPDLIDVWFDSGAMPYAQFHYPFEKANELSSFFPADFIAEGVDQTRGWFFTLHAIATMAFDNVAFKNVISNGLVLDKAGNKMSKRLGNAIDPFDTIEKYGPDATRWYMISNSQPWDNLKFDIDGIAEVQRKFFGTIYNTYCFFALYANIDNFCYKEKDIEIENRPEIDQWMLSELNTLIELVDNCYASYEPTKAARAISDFTDERLSNWFVRLSRRRFWKGEYTNDKISAYQTLYTCLETIAILIAPIAPFYADHLFNDLNKVTKKYNKQSVHLIDFPESDKTLINKLLENKMQLAQKISSMVLSLRKQHRIRVRQPLSKIMIPVIDKLQADNIDAVKQLILSEVNIKNIEYLTETGLLVKRIKPNFKTLGPRYGKLMKQIADALNNISQNEIGNYDINKELSLTIDNETVTIKEGDAEIITEDIPGWVVLSDSNLTVALDITITQELKNEGIARELINRIQNIRKDKNFEVTDKIIVQIFNNKELVDAINSNFDYICSEILANKLIIAETIDKDKFIEIEIIDGITGLVSVEKVN